MGPDGLGLAPPPKRWCSHHSACTRVSIAMVEAEDAIQEGAVEREQGAQEELVKEDVAEAEADPEKGPETDEKVDAEVEGTANEGEEEEKEPERKKQKTQTPVDLGPMKFSNAAETCAYFSDILSHFTAEQDLNEYEFTVLLDLLVKGHKDPQQKIGAGVQSFQIRNHPTYGSNCFYICRVDGTSEDFSFRKCVARLFPDETLPHGSTTAKSPSSHGGGRSGRGAGRGSRGGRGGRSSRGRGRGRGRGRRGR